MEALHLIGVVISASLLGGVVLGIALISVNEYFDGRRGRKKKRKISFATRRKCRKLRRAGEDSKAALRKFHATKRAARIEALQAWQAKYDELQPKLANWSYKAIVIDSSYYAKHYAKR